jgi:hypothetical protein
MSRKLEEFTDTLIDTVVYSVAELKIETSDVSVFYPKDWMPKGLGEELIIFVDGLFDKPERTEKVRNRLADAITQTAHEFFPQTGLIECFIRPFNEKQGFCSIRNIKKNKAVQFPEILEVGGISKEELMKNIFMLGYEIAPQALDLISKDWFSTSPEKKTVKLCRKTVAQMGFNREWTEWEEIKAWIEENGQLCDNELALKLRLAYSFQPIDEELFIASSFQFFRVTNFAGKLSVFRNGVDGFQAELSSGEKKPTEVNSSVYCLYNEFVYYEK